LRHGPHSSYRERARERENAREYTVIAAKHTEV
jgi:hypothetical protein